MGKLHKIFRIIWVCPTENKTHLRYFSAFSITLIFCRLSHYFRFILKTSPADTEPRVWEEKGQSNLYLTRAVWSPCHRLGPRARTTSQGSKHMCFLAFARSTEAIGANMCARLQRRPQIDGFPAKWPVADASESSILACVEMKCSDMLARSWGQVWMKTHTLMEQRRSS